MTKITKKHTIRTLNLYIFRSCLLGSTDRPELWRRSKLRVLRFTRVGREPLRRIMLESARGLPIPEILFTPKGDCTGLSVQYLGSPCELAANDNRLKLPSWQVCAEFTLRRLAGSAADSGSTPALMLDLRRYSVLDRNWGLIFPCSCKVATMVPLVNITSYCPTFSSKTTTTVPLIDILHIRSNFLSKDSRFCS